MKSEIHVRYELIILFMDSCPCQIIFLSPMRGHLWCLQGGWDARRILAKSRCRVASRAVMWMFQWFTWHGHLAASFFLYKKSKDKRFGNDNNNNNNLSVATCFWLHAPTADVYIYIYIYICIDFGWVNRIMCSCLTLGIKSPCLMMIGVYNPLLREVFRFHEAILRRWLDPWG